MQMAPFYMQNLTWHPVCLPTAKFGTTLVQIGASELIPLLQTPRPPHYDQKDQSQEEGRAPLQPNRH